MVLFRTALADASDLWIPDVIAGYSGKTVLTMEYSAGERVDLYARLLTGAIAFAALVIGGSMLLMTPVGDWHDTLGETLIISGIVGMLITGIGALRRGHGQR